MYSNFRLTVYQSHKASQLFISIVDFDAYNCELKSSKTKRSNASIFWCLWWANACFLAICFSFTKFSSSTSLRSNFFLFWWGKINLQCIWNQWRKGEIFNLKHLISKWYHTSANMSKILGGLTYLGSLRVFPLTSFGCTSSSPLVSIIWSLECDILATLPSASR